MFNKKTLYIIAAVGVVAVIGGLVAYKSYTSYKSDTSDRTDTADRSDTTNRTDTADRSDTTDVSAADLQPAPAAARYVNKRYGFSFDKPDGYTVGAVTEGEGEMILVQSNKTDTSDKSYSGFQIFITPLDQPVELSPEFIKKDLPGTAVNNPQAILLDGKGKGMMFESNNEAFGGRSFEIWFVYKPQINADTTYLYQITSYASFAPELKKIIGSWKFNQ